MIERFKTHRVERWGVLYLAAAWLTLEILDVVGQGYGWSDAAIRVGASVVALGLPLVLWLAWWRTKDERRALKLGEAVLVVGLAVAATGFGVVARTVLRTGPNPLAAADSASKASPGWASGATAIAVLPFVDGTGREDSYLAQGLYEEILVALSKVREFRVTSRTSSLRFETDGQTPVEISQALDVGSLVTGSVRIVGDQIRVSIELVDPSGDVIWSENYDRRPDDLFAIQADVAASVAHSLQAVITRPEHERIATRPTASVAAYEKLQRARELIRKPGYEFEDLSLAAHLLEEALDEDPSFALAYAQLAGVHVVLYRFALDRSPDRLESAERALRRALSLDPELTETNVALGFKLYQVDRDYDGAVEAFQRARATTPSDARAIAGLGFVRRRQGRWEEAIEQFRAATVVDPLNTDHWLALGTTFKGMRRYEAAEFAYRRMQAIEPESHIASLQLGHLRVDWLGELDTLRDAVLAAREAGISGRRTVYAAFRVHFYAREYEEALGVLNRSDIESFDGSSVVRPVSLLRAWTLAAAGAPTEARESFDRARSVLETRLGIEGEDARFLSALALALAGLGERKSAIAAASRAVALESTHENHMHGPGFAADLARVLVAVGETTRATGLIKDLLETHGGLTPAQLRLDPTWAPRGNLSASRD